MICASVFSLPKVSSVLPSSSWPTLRPVAGRSDVGPVHPVFERTAENLLGFQGDFLERWLAGDAVAAEAVEDALWTVSVERAPAAPQRIVLAIRQQMNLPVKYVGVGEQVDDLELFDPDAFVDALFET